MGVLSIGEIIALLLYHYYYDRMSRTARLRISFLYFLFAWLSLFVINGIIDFMLTPGLRLAGNRDNFWDGFFNPTYWPSLFFRSFICFTFAGLFGYVTTVFLEDREFRQKMVGYCTKWLLYPLIGPDPIAAAWYFYSVPADVRQVTFQMNKLTGMWVDFLLVATVLIFLLGVLMSASKSLSIQRLAVVLLVPIGLMWMGGFEYTREISRKPYVLFGYMYSNSILKSDVDRINSEGILKLAKWSAVKEVDTGKPVAGRPRNLQPGVHGLPYDQRPAERHSSQDRAVGLPGPDRPAIRAGQNAGLHAAVPGHIRRKKPRWRRTSGTMRPGP